MEEEESIKLLDQIVTNLVFGKVLTELTRNERLVNNYKKLLNITPYLESSDYCFGASLVYIELKESPAGIVLIRKLEQSGIILDLYQRYIILEVAK